jgi:1,4-dihydroxy-2-naphthoate octaprenyltransferase
MKILRSILFWLRNARCVALPQSLFPALIALKLAYPQAGFSWQYAILALFGVVFAHLSANLFDDYFDFKQSGGCHREILASSGLKVRIAKCNYITSGETTTKRLFQVASSFAVIALFIGCYIGFHRGFPIFLIAILGGFLLFFYSAKPLKLSYRGLGEIIVTLLFGPLLMSGVYYAAVGDLPLLLWFISFPMGILAGNVLYTHSILDFASDEKALKITLARWLKTPTKMLIAAFLFIFSPYLIILIGVFFKIVNISLLLVFFSLPLAIMLFYLLYQFLYFPDKKFKPVWWIKPMERWEKIEELGIDWFMIRWYLARNMMIYFSLLLFISLFF